MVRLSEIVAYGLVLLLVLGVSQPASARSVPLLSPPTAQSEQADQPEAPTGLPAHAQQVISSSLADANPQIRANAAEVVAATRSLRLMPQVHKLLADEVVPVRFAATLAVGDLAYGAAKNDIIRLLNDPNPNIQIAASYAISRLGNPEYYKVLCDATASEDQTVRANATLLLGKSGRQDGLPVLYGTLQRTDSTDKVILQAAESLAMLKDRRIYPRLWTRLISAYADDRVIGIRAMGTLGTEEARSALVTMLDDPVPEVRLVAAEHLGKLGDPVGEQTVLEILKRDPSADADAQSRERIQMLTALAIGEIGTPAVTKRLPALLKDSSKVVRLAAAKGVLRAASKRSRS
ncbi:MAG: HEAT repeat domain-containing protein [Phycisphaerae bacterium]|nr:HEAT repeat domain-containing protein [Phycisphaerae bacterium]